MTPRKSAIKTDLFAADFHQQKLDQLGDPLLRIASCIDFRTGIPVIQYNFKVPDGRAIRKTCSIHQTAKTLIAMAIQQLILHLLV